MLQKHDICSDLGYKHVHFTYYIYIYIYMKIKLNLHQGDYKKQQQDSDNNMIVIFRLWSTEGAMKLFFFYLKHSK